MEYANIKNEYNDSYQNLTFGDGYLIGVHGIQTALYMQDYDSITENMNMNDINYGYFDSSTEKMIKTFQESNNLYPTGTLTQETWNAIFDGLLKEEGVIIGVTGKKQITIFDIDDVIDEKNEQNKFITSGGKNFDGLKDYEYITGEGERDFNSNGEFTTNSDSLGGQNFGSNTSNRVIGDRGNTLEQEYGSGYSGSDYGNTSYWNGEHPYNGKEYFDEIQHGYYTNGGNSIVPNFSINIPDTNRWNGTTIKDIDTGNYQKDYDFVYNLLANTSYNLGGYTKQLKKSNSTTDTLTNYSGDYESSTSRPFFDPSNILTLRRSKFDIDLVYGAKGLKSRKIVNVVPMSVSQQVDASGEPIFDIYEFIAQDVIYSDN